MPPQKCSCQQRFAHSSWDKTWLKVLQRLGIIWWHRKNPWSPLKRKLFAIQLSSLILPNKFYVVVAPLAPSNPRMLMKLAVMVDHSNRFDESLTVYARAFDASMSRGTILPCELHWVWTQHVHRQSKIWEHRFVGWLQFTVTSMVRLGGQIGDQHPWTKVVLEDPRRPSFSFPLNSSN